MSKEEALSITPQSAGSTSSVSVSSMMDKIQRKVLHELTVVNDIKHKQILKEKRAKVKHSGNILQPHFKKTRHSWTPERRLHILKRIADLRMQVYAAKGVRVGVAKVLHYLKTQDSTMESVHQSMVSRWLKEKKVSLKKAGRKVNAEFEAAVISKLFVMIALLE